MIDAMVADGDIVVSAAEHERNGDMVAVWRANATT
jgi:hypothetical protein